jgi:hypothetical protein
MLAGVDMQIKIKLAVLGQLYFDVFVRQVKCWVRVKPALAIFATIEAKKYKGPLV